MSRAAKIGYTILLAVAIFTLFGCNMNQEKQEERLVTAKVTKVVDGDTIKVTYKGQEESVRFLLIDAPELKHRDFAGPQPYALEAKEFLTELLEDQDVELELGINQRDKYGRLLAWVFFEGKSVQEMLLEQGLARVAYVYSPNLNYLDEYRSIQETAQKKAVGIWSIENYATDKGFSPIDNPATSQNDKPNTSKTSSHQTCNIKGNINSKGEKIYHVPGGQYYDQTKPEKWFCSEEEAESEGYRKSMR